MKTAEQTIDDHLINFKKLQNKVVEIEKKTIRLDTEKVNIVENKAVLKKLNQEMKKITVKNEEIVNQQISLESWIEKYMPLKLQHQITETVGECLGRKQK